MNCQILEKWKRILKYFSVSAQLTSGQINNLTECVTDRDTSVIQNIKVFQQASKVPVTQVCFMLQ